MFLCGALPISTSQNCLLFGTLAAILNGLVFPTSALLISSVIKTFYEKPHQLRKDSNFWAPMYLTLELVALVAYSSRIFFFSVAASKLVMRIRSKCFEKVVHMEVGWFDDPEHSSGAIGARLSANAAMVRALVGDTIAQVVQDSTTATAGLVIAFLASWQLAIIVFALVPLIIMKDFVQLKYTKGFSTDSKVRSTQL